MSTKYVKEGLTAVTPFLAVPDVPAAIDFYVRVFEAVDVRRDADPSGVVRHAVLSIGDAPVELGQHDGAARTPAGQLPVTAVHLYVPDVDATWARAQAAGAVGTAPVDQPYGDRESMVVDPFGVVWYVATSKS